MRLVFRVYLPSFTLLGRDGWISLPLPCCRWAPPSHSFSLPLPHPWRMKEGGRRKDDRMKEDLRKECEGREEGRKQGRRVNPKRTINPKSLKP